MSRLRSPRLRSLIRALPTTNRSAAHDDSERCDMCGGRLAEQHAHVLERTTRAMFCACRPCALLFDHDAAGGDRFRLIPAERERLSLVLDDLAWRSLGLPVELAFFVRTADGGVLAFYPSPAGAVESLVALDSWAELERDNPELATLQPDVEALLVNRIGAARDAWRVGVDVCFRLVALFRTHWTGMSGGIAVRAELARFFADLESARTPLRA